MERAQLRPFSPISLEKSGKPTVNSDESTALIFYNFLLFFSLGLSKFWAPFESTQNFGISNFIKKNGLKNENLRHLN